ncbi:spondin domain-containing protein [Ichthyenterobacterium sp. W332]|uniref:Spondin domain-containing protein n=1 Tax=Microcosmobacter mediterraneus TaxID=3075607 RepID=A0ABU2YQS8_9FLAO|nr:spondin domain-containing protein [Ichthyenterobacterium sp. W332]MDT0559438.1 spondin domain-containing protein [Ichthyenterobacterium sp. W332]
MKTKLLLVLLITSNFIFTQSRAIYNITFESTWNSSDHGTLPGNAHWSDLVGATHNSNITFLEMGEMATKGIEDVAEIGNNFEFNSEVLDAINDGNADQWIQRSVNPFAAIATATINNLEIDEDYPLLTLASMIAPSPDWMIAVSNVNLRDGNNWINMMTIDLFPYDAGTENGFGYSTSNTATNPQSVISNIANVAGYPFNSNKIGTLTIELQNVLNVNTFQNENLISIYPNPSEDFISISRANSLRINAVEIYDVLGKLVYKTNDSKDKIDISHLNNGIYMTKFFIENKTIIIKRIIKN